MTFVKAFGRFWYDFLVGDDWKIAASVVLTLALLVAVLRADVIGEGALADDVGGVALMVAFSISLAIDTRRSRAGK